MPPKLYHNVLNPTKELYKMKTLIFDLCVTPPPPRPFQLYHNDLNLVRTRLKLLFNLNMASKTVN